ncbi:UPF0728 protein C10orf53 homolog isoform X3 [Mastomys coucha]|uniref:UPF0728 protein C10orf53 homolog isoform X3 n=1 Tax=Mastomys coucha TaxID=35658 RepID=UPI001261EF08|nr:UPF0728 protein C10orf53 homolog isoform X3 [Mastomys coucha]
MGPTAQWACPWSTAPTDCRVCKVPSLLQPHPRPQGRNTGGIPAMFFLQLSVGKKNGSNQKLQWLKMLQHIWHLTWQLC